MKPFTTFVLALLLLSCGKQADDLVDKAGESVGKQISNFSRAVGEGVDNEMLVKLNLDKAVQELGLTSTTAKRLPIDESKKGISVYLIASKDVEATLRAIAKNGQDVEIGRSKLPVKMKKDDAAYFIFEFDQQMDSMTAKEYSISVVPN